MIISGHCLIKDESRFIWYAIMSVINHLDKLLIWDTGSSDTTIEIIRQVSKVKLLQNKIQLKEFKPKVFKEEEYRQNMLNETKGDWIFTLDGDEIWWEDSIKGVMKALRNPGDKIESIVMPTYNPVGDLFHYQEESAGRYKLAGKIGHLNLRAFSRSIPGLAWSGKYGMGGWIDKDGRRIQDREKSKIKFLNCPYMHTSFLKRSLEEGIDKKVYKRKKKFKYELGIPFSKDFYYPEVFFRPRPEIVPSVWETTNFSYNFRAFFETPMRKVYRRTILPFKKHGY